MGECRINSGSATRCWRRSKVERGAELSPRNCICIQELTAGYRIRNKAKLTPKELVDPRNTSLRAMLQNAEFTMTAGDDIVNQDEEDEGPTGSASDSE